jgi:hypothetical protein
MAVARPSGIAPGAPACKIHRSVSARSRPTLAIGLAFAVAAQALVGIAHLGERHERCAEHGELIHVATVPGLRGPDAASSLGPLSVLSASSSPSGDPHEHCGVPATMRKRVTCDCPTATEHVSVAVAAILPSSDVEPFRLVVHRLAPKTSPPA